MADTLQLKVTGMTCGGCETAVRRTLEKLDGVEEVTASHAAGLVGIRFDADRASITFDKHYLSLPLTRSAADLDNMLKGALRLTVLPYRRDRLLVERVRRVLRNARGRSLGAEDVASELALSTRTMHRRLREEATSLRDLKEEAKFELAKQELMRGRTPIKRIAEIAGFRNEKSFSRAFRSWTGASPREFRGRYR